LRIGILGDIHGNHLALEAVLNSVREKGITKLLITGDSVGYYFWPDKVIEMLKGWDFEMVRGNHEDMLRQSLRDKNYLLQIDARYGKGIRTAIERLNQAQLDWLTSLPHPLVLDVGGCRILLCHGAPWDVNLYVYPDATDSVIARFRETSADWILTGHTHYPMIRKIGGKTIVNPGSVGQQRNRVRGAHWAMLDTVSGKVSAFVEAYDDIWVAEQARLISPEIPYLAEVLLRS